MSRRSLSLALGVVISGFAFGAYAGPGLPVTKPPLIGGSTGPLVDPGALQGQWFKAVNTGAETPLPFEFHDNVDLYPADGQHYGGGYLSYLAIEGFAANIVFAAAPGTNIVSFDIHASITNDVPALSPWLEGLANSHGETTPPRQQIVRDLLDTRLTADFALADLQLVPNGFSAPYRQGFLPFIVAANEDQRAWYCYTPGSSEQGLSTAVGDYYVPAWDFGDIPMGQTRSRDLSFTVDGPGLSPADPRYLALLSGLDLLSNRSTSLKIDTWLDNLTADAGVPYPSDPLAGSDVGVFFVPEPGSIAVLTLAGMLALRRKPRQA